MVLLFMNVLIKPILQDKITFWGFLISILLIIISIGYSGIFLNALPPYLPLYNKMPWGYGRLGTRFEIFVPIIIVSVFTLGNIFSSAYIYAKIPLLSRLICLVSLFVALLSCIFIIKITSLVL